MPTIVIRVGRHPGRKLRELARSLSSGGPAKRRLLFAVGKAVLQKVHEAFGVKALGGTDAAGLKWKALSPVTIAIKKALKKKKPTISLDVLTETKLLQKSLTPPAGKSPTSRRDQVFVIGQDSVTVGTSRKWAYTHHYGIPGRLPQHRLWPELSSWPRSWWDHIQEEIRMELVEIITKMLR